MAKLTLRIEGVRRDLNELGFAMFDHMIRYETAIDVPGGATLTLKPEELRKAVGTGLMEVVLNLSEGFAASLLANWLFAKWQKSGAPPSITIRIENRYYQLDPEVLTKALEGAAQRLKKQELSAPALKVPSRKREVSSVPAKTRKKAQH